MRNDRFVYYNGTCYIVHRSRYRKVIGVLALRGLEPTLGYRHWYWNR